MEATTHSGQGPQCAAALFTGDDIELVWCNPQYQRMLDEPYNTEGAVGHRLQDFSAISYTMRAQAIRALMSGGESQSGEDRVFSVSEGTQLYRWSLHAVAPNMVLALVETATVR